MYSGGASAPPFFVFSDAAQDVRRRKQVLTKQEKPR
jgi:hypothetical protein